MNECAFTRWFCSCLKAVNTEVVAMVGSMRQKAGLPDRYVCHTRFRGWLEFKLGDRRLTTTQHILMKRLLERGDTCLVVRYRKKGTIEIESLSRKILVYQDITVLHTLQRTIDKAAVGRELLNLLTKADGNKLTKNLKKYI